MATYSSDVLYMRKQCENFIPWGLALLVCLRPRTCLGRLSQQQKNQEKPRKKEEIIKDRKKETQKQESGKEERGKKEQEIKEDEEEMTKEEKKTSLARTKVRPNG